jgi:hypothetical protein
MKMRDDISLNTTSKYKPARRRMLGRERKFLAQDVENFLLKPFKEEILTVLVSKSNGRR